MMTLEDRVTSLIAICRENSDSYTRAAEILVGEPDTAHFFEEIAENRLLASNALEKKLLQTGKRLNADIFTAPPHEGWTQPTGGETDPRSVIEACHEAEERAISAFDAALQALPEDWDWLLNEYSQHMRSAVAKMHAWLEGKESASKRERSGVRAAANRTRSPHR
jgi:hypothetical protein